MSPSHRFPDPHVEKNEARNRRRSRLHSSESHRGDPAVDKKLIAEPYVEKHLDLAPEEIERRERDRQALLAGLHVPEREPTQTVSTEPAVAELPAAEPIIPV